MAESNSQAREQFEAWARENGFETPQSVPYMRSVPWQTGAGEG